MTQTIVPPDHPVPDTHPDRPDPDVPAATGTSRRTVLAGVIVGGVLIGLFSTAVAIGGATLSGHAEAGVVGSAQEPAPTGTELLSAKVQAATIHDVLPSAMPITVDTPVTDEPGVLSEEDHERVAQAVAAVETTTSLRLYVVYLETFDGIPPEDWADATATKSGLAPEELLLAIATMDHTQGLSVDVNGPLSSREHASIVAASQSAVDDGEWADAAVDAADAALAAADLSGPPWWQFLAPAAAVLAAAIATWWYLRRRRSAGGEDDVVAESAETGDGEAAVAASPAETDSGTAASVPAVSVPAASTAEATAPPTATPPLVAAPDEAPVSVPEQDVPVPDDAGWREPVAADMTPARDATATRETTPAAVTTAAAATTVAAGPAGTSSDPVDGNPADDSLTDSELADNPDVRPASDALPAATPHEPSGEPSEESLSEPSEEPSSEPSGADLITRLDDALITLDNALRTSAQELELARAESRSGSTHDLEALLADAAGRAEEAFMLRDESQSAEADALEDLAHQALAACTEASKLLDSGTAPLEEIRRLKSRANRLLDQSWQRAGVLDREIEQARETLADLAAQFPADAVRPVVGNAELADRLVHDVRLAIDTGRAASAKRDRGFAAAAARGAQHALLQAERLVHEVESTRSDLTDAAAWLDKAVASLTQDVADTDRVSGGDPQAAMARTTARAALKQVEVARGAADPFALLARIAAAESALDQALARHRDLPEIEARTTALVRDTLSRLEVRLRQVDTLIATRRSVVGPEARTRYSEAKRLTAAAYDARARADRTSALDLAHRADLQAYQALTAALRDSLADGAPHGMSLAGIDLALEGRRGHGAGSGTRGGLLGLLTRSPSHVRTGGIGGGHGGGFGSGRDL